MSTIVDLTSTGPRPPRQLGEYGRELWTAVMAEYDIADRGGIEILAQAAAALDLAETLAAEIARDGAVVRSRNGTVKAHPAVAAELGARALVVRCIEKLGLNLEPIRPTMGPPPGRHGKKHVRD